MRVMRLFAVALGLCGLCGSQPLCEINPNPAYKDARDALDQILEALHLPTVYFLYWSSDPLMNDFGGAASTECAYANGMQKWIVYDPKAIKGDLTLHFVLAHELAHHAD